jgi:hypothetical protein
MPFRGNFNARRWLMEKGLSRRSFNPFRRWGFLSRKTNCNKTSKIMKIVITRWGLNYNLRGERTNALLDEQMLLNRISLRTAKWMQFNVNCLLLQLRGIKLFFCFQFLSILICYSLLCALLFNNVLEMDGKAGDGGDGKRKKFPRAFLISKFMIIAN